jgi:hypothetical protein
MDARGARMNTRCFLVVRIEEGRWAEITGKEKI